jgi:hypothetical protein
MRQVTGHERQEVDTMGYRTQGWLHAQMHHMNARVIGAQTGQGTVEYVGLILLVSALLVGVVAAGKGMKGNGIAETIANKLKETINDVK